MIRKILTLFNVTILPMALVKNRGLLWQFACRAVETRYKGSVLGLVWMFVQPLMMLTVYTFVFSVVFKAKWGVDSIGSDKGSFAVVMFCGMSLYNLFAETVNMSCTCISSNANLVKKVVFPLEVLPAAQVLATFLLGLAWFVLLFFGSWFVLGFVGWTMLLFPLVLIPLMLFSLGVAYFTAALGVFVKDTLYAAGVVLQILFFATPIFYPISAVPDRFRWVLEWNPLTVYIEQMRNVFLYGNMPDWRFLGLAALASFVMLQLGFFFFIRTKKGFADVL